LIILATISVQVLFGSLGEAASQSSAIQYARCRD
jgi:hypothetical protein